MIRYMLLAVIGFALIFAAPPASSHYPLAPEPKGGRDLDDQHVRLHELKGHAWAMVKHPRSYRELVWHRKALRRINSRLVDVHHQFAVRRSTGAAMAWYHQADTQCVANHEGGFASVNPAGYYGRFQMDIQFQRTYGPEFYNRWGTADRWPGWAQIVAAYRGYQARGWNPWPTYGRYCA